MTSPSRPTTRRQFLGGLAAGLALAGCRRQEPAAGQPNVVLLIADQLRSSALGCTGNEVVKTPHLDRLAAQGALFTNAFACSPVCSPARAQILTGKFSGSSGKIRKPGNLLYKLPLEETTLAEILRQQGYATGFIGKWHLSPQDLETANGFVPPGPARQGFKTWAAIEVPSGHYNAKYFTDSPQPLVARGFSCDVETDLAIDYLESHRDQPFFLTVSWNPPHNPYTPPRPFDVYDPATIPLHPNVPAELAATARESLAGYYGLISAVDANVGKILDALETLDLTRQTIVLFVSDHGDMHGSQGVRLEEGAKRRPWSESCQVPFLVSYPGTVVPGQVHDALVGTVDIVPTLLALAGVEVPGWVQGLDHSPLILGEPFHERSSIFLHITAGGRSTPLAAPWRAVRTKEHLFAVSAGLEQGDWLLYDLRQDPFEMVNLIDDPARGDRKQDLRTQLDAWRTEIGDDLDLRQFYELKRAGRRPWPEVDDDSA